jgi:putative peptidoglycan lipid II flippase
VRIAIGVLLATQLMNAVFVPGLGHAGLALSIGLAALVNAGLLLAGLLRRGTYRPRPGWVGFSARVVGANAAVAACLAAAAREIDWIGLQAHAGQRVAAVAGVLAGVAGLYFAILAACGLRPGPFMRRG